MEMTSGAGVDRIVDVDFGANQASSLQIIKTSGVIASYASAADMVPALQFYGFMFKDVTLRMLIAYHLTGARHQAGEAALAKWLEDGALSHAVVPGGGLGDIVAAHEKVEAGEKLGTVVLEIE